MVEKVTSAQIYIRSPQSQNLIVRKYTNVEIVHTGSSDSENEDDEEISDSNSTQSGVCYKR